MTAVATINPFVLHEDYVRPKEHAQSENSTHAVRLSIEKFDIYEDYEPGIEHEKSDNSSTLPKHPSDPLALTESVGQSLLTDWVETERDCDGPVPAPSWLSTVTAPLAGVYNAVTGSAPIGKSDTDQSLLSLKQRAKHITSRIQDNLERLDKSVGSENEAERLTPDAERLDSVGLSTYTRLQNFVASARGTGTAILDATGEVATGVAIGGVATTGILGAGFGVAALSAAVTLILDSVRNLGGRANRLRMRNVIEQQLPEIQGDLKELDCLISQEQQRHTISQRITTTMLLRRERCMTMQDAVGCAASELIRRAMRDGKLENGSAGPAVALSITEQIALQYAMRVDAIRSGMLAQLVRARDALHSFIAPFVRGFDRLSERLFSTPQAREAAADKKAEEIFKKRSDSMLFDMSCGEVRSILESGALLDACRNMRKGGVSTEAITDIDMLRDIKIGETLTRTILSSGPNCGIVSYKPGTPSSAGRTSEREYAVSSNLTLVRSIAQYIDAQAIANARNLVVTSTTLGVSQGVDGSYTIPDPERKLFSFLACAPTACSHIPSPADTSTLASLMGTSAVSMTIADYSGTFPGGANQMEFEAKIDKSGANILTVRFLKQNDESMLRPDQAKAAAYIRNLYDNKDVEQTPIEMKNFTDVPTAEVEAYLDSMTAALKEQATLLKAEQHQYGVLQKWEHPALAKHA